VRTNVCADFWNLAIFDRNFVKIMAPSSVKNENYIVRLKERSLLKNAENGIKIDP